MIEPWMIRIGVVVLVSGAVNLGLLWIEARMRRAGMIPPSSATPATIALRRMWNQSQESGRGLTRWMKSILTVRLGGPVLDPGHTGNNRP